MITEYRYIHMYIIRGDSTTYSNSPADSFPNLLHQQTSFSFPPMLVNEFLGRTFKIISSYFSRLIFAFSHGLAIRYCFLVISSLVHGLRRDSFFMDKDRNSWGLFYSVSKFRSSGSTSNHYAFIYRIFA